MVHIPFYCDGCDEPILDVRYKCLQCRDFDLCFLCSKDESVTRSNHDPATHVLIREELASDSVSTNGPVPSSSSSTSISSTRTGGPDNPLTEYSILEGMQYFHLNLERIATHAHTTLDTVYTVIDRIADRETGRHVLPMDPTDTDRDTFADAVPSMDVVALPPHTHTHAWYVVCAAVVM